MGKKNLFNSISCSLLQHSAACRLIETYYPWNNYKSIYVHLPFYQVETLFQRIKQSMNQFSKTQRSVAAAGYPELRRNSVSKNLSPISILQTSDFFQKSSAVCVFCGCFFACIQLSFWKTSGEKKNKIFIEHGRLILTY